MAFGLRREIMSIADSWKTGLSQEAVRALAGRVPAGKPSVPCGGDFVNLNYKILCRNSHNVFITFRPADLHGTTLPYGAHSCAISITSSPHIADAYTKGLCTIEQSPPSENAIFPSNPNST